MPANFVVGVIIDSPSSLLYEILIYKRISNQL
jgi:hypothetical protein